MRAALMDRDIAKLVAPPGGPLEVLDTRTQGRAKDGDVLVTEALREHLRRRRRT